MDGEDHLISAPPGAGEETHIPGLNDLRIAEPKSGVVEDGLPTHLNEFASGLCCYVWDDKMTVEYHGFGRDHNDAASVQANRPVSKQKLLFYFEMTVKNRGLRGAIAIGFSTENFNTHMQPGLELNSYGYHGDDGKLFTGYGMGTPLGPQFSTGDTMGAGINYAAQEILFTKNGQLVGRAAFEEIEDPLYPTVGLGSLDEKVVVNFG